MLGAGWRLKTKEAPSGPQGPLCPLRETMPSILETNNERTLCYRQGWCTWLYVLINRDAFTMIQTLGPTLEVLIQLVGGGT